MSAKPWDLFNPEIGRVTDEVQEKRYAICQECPRFLSLTKQCLECGCFMQLKTKLPNATCPLNKWD
jgi:hypothetical protein